jgi:hypothetical protein
MDSHCLESEDKYKLVFSQRQLENGWWEQLHSTNVNWLMFTKWLDEDFHRPIKKFNETKFLTY